MEVVTRSLCRQDATHETLDGDARYWLNMLLFTKSEDHRFLLLFAVDTPAVDCFD